MKYDKPEIFNLDQDSQYTAKEHSKLISKHNILIFMNGECRSIDNIAIERFFRTLKYEDIYSNKYESLKELRIITATICKNNFLKILNHSILKLGLSLTLRSLLNHSICFIKRVVAEIGIIFNIFKLLNIGR